MYCRAAYTSSLSTGLCWLESAPHLLHHPRSLPRLLAHLPFFSAFSDEFFEERHLLFFLLGAVHFEVLDLQQYSFLMNSVHFCPYQDPQVGVLRSWANALRVTSPQPINDRFVVIMNRSRIDSFLEKTPEGRLLRSFGGALHHELGIQRSVHPVHRPHLVVIELHQ